MTRPDLDAILPPVSTEDESTVDALLAKAREGVGKRPIGRRPDIDAIRERNLVDWTGNGKWELSGDVATLLAYVEELEAEAATLRHRDTLLKRVDDALAEAGCVQPLSFDGTIESAIKDLARRATRAEQLFVDEYDAHQETRTLLTDLYMKQLRADAAQMREYGISYAGIRQLFAEYDGGELSIGKVLELLRAAARELAKEEIAELKARITTLEAMR